MPADDAPSFDLSAAKTPDMRGYTLRLASHWAADVTITEDNPRYRDPIRTLNARLVYAAAQAQLCEHSEVPLRAARTLAGWLVGSQQLSFSQALALPVAKAIEIVNKVATKATHDGGKLSGGEGDGTSGDEETGRDEILEQMQSAQRKAYFAFEFAESKTGRRLQDREAYDLLKDEGIPDASGDLGDLTDYVFPSFGTWSRHLRLARNALGEQKHKPRKGRPTGNSIVGNDEI